MADDDGLVAGSTSIGDSDLALPKATVTKLIKDMLPSYVRISNDACDLILDCCTEFIHLLSSEANELCGKDSKKTILSDHILAALKSLGFDDYISEVTQSLQDHTEEVAKRPKGNSLEKSGLSKEELLRQQQQLFAQARLAHQNSLTTPTPGATPSAGGASVLGSPFVPAASAAEPTGAHTPLLPSTASAASSAVIMMRIDKKREDDDENYDE